MRPPVRAPNSRPANAPWPQCAQDQSNRENRRSRASNRASFPDPRDGRDRWSPASAPRPRRAFGEDGAAAIAGHPRCIRRHDGRERLPRSRPAPIVRSKNGLRAAAAPAVRKQDQRILLTLRRGSVERHGTSRAMRIGMGRFFLRRWIPHRHLRSAGNLHNPEADTARACVLTVRADCRDREYVENGNYRGWPLTHD